MTQDWMITIAAEQDAGEIMTVQRAAYVSEALLYKTTGLSALSEPLEDILKAVTAGEVLVAKVGSRIVGAVRGVRKGDECYKEGDFAGSMCEQPWRWNLDYVVDPHGNAVSYYYQPE
ncbi:hypothetical protein ACFQ1S_25825, partial [Kibdelosporangium lantanae]